MKCFKYVILHHDKDSQFSLIFRIICKWQSRLTIVCRTTFVFDVGIYYLNSTSFQQLKLYFLSHVRYKTPLIDSLKLAMSTYISEIFSDRTQSNKLTINQSIITARLSVLRYLLFVITCSFHNIRDLKHKNK